MKHGARERRKLAKCSMAQEGDQKVTDRSIVYEEGGR
jgi:hypothetical protein